jgi:pimeloyl-ACP methyl ester carboxylesterase
MVLLSLSAQHRVFAPDLPGFGESGNPAGLLAGVFERFVCNLLDVPGLDRAILVGNYLGGLAALRLALTSPAQVSALCLVGSAGLGGGVSVALWQLTRPGFGDAAATWAGPGSEPRSDACCVSRCCSPIRPGPRAPGSPGEDVVGRRWFLARLGNTAGATAAWLASVWLFASWMPHAALHQHVGTQPAALLAIEWVFHGGAIAAISALLWTLSSAPGRVTDSDHNTIGTTTS